MTMIVVNQFDVPGYCQGGCLNRGFDQELRVDCPADPPTNSKWLQVHEFHMETDLYNCRLPSFFQEI